jgi:hypothetical protein
MQVASRLKAQCASLFKADASQRKIVAQGYTFGHFIETF